MATPEPPLPGAPPSLERRAAWPRLPRYRVLVVETDDGLRGLLVRVLRDAGYGAVEAPDAAAARAAAAYLPPDLVLLDAAAPGLDGLMGASPARRRRRGAPVVVTVAIGDGAARERARAAGAVGVLAKPFSREALLRAVHAALAGGATGS